VQEGTSYGGFTIDAFGVTQSPVTKDVGIEAFVSRLLAIRNEFRVESAKMNVLRPLSSPTEYENMSDEDVAVRLLISEIGADRLVNNQNAVQEAVGILWTVRNRLDEETYNPEDAHNLQPYPGCGDDSTFKACMLGHDDGGYQFQGLGYSLGLDPVGYYLNEADYPNAVEMVHNATEIALEAYDLATKGTADDPTGGAVAYLHYEDEQTGNTATGPIVFFAPEALLEGGYYRLDESSRIPYVP
jgi:hypothetical protein